MSTSFDKNDCFWGIADASCKSRSIIEREPDNYKQIAATKAKSQGCFQGRTQLLNFSARSRTSLLFPGFF
jgi:hypothetical protein